MTRNPFPDDIPSDGDLCEGMEVLITDAAGTSHRGIITAITDDEDPVLTVVLDCRGSVSELSVHEQDVVARLHQGGGY